MDNLAKTKGTEKLTVNKSLCIRPFNINDLANILAIEKAAQISPWSKGHFLDSLHVGHICWLLEQNNEIIGYIIFSLKAQECEILNLCIKSTQQKRGFGTKLLQKALQFTKNHNIDMIFLEVRESNKAAINLYNKIGFNELGIRKNYYPAKKGREDAIILGLDLTIYK
jgi:ribosomal-protein-alanine N-acetyltransferase